MKTINKPKKNYTRKVISMVLIICLIICMPLSLSGCGADADSTAPAGSSGKNNNATTQAMDAGKIIKDSDESITVIDQAGREVTVSKDIDSIALCYRVIIRFLLNLDQGEKIKGIGKTEKFLYELEPKLKDCVDVGKGVADIEALAELSPDIFFHKASDKKTLEKVESIGIPSIGIKVETPEDMKGAIDLMGKVLGAEEKAKELIDYYDSKLSWLNSKTKDIGKSNKKTAIMMGSSLGDVADGSMLQSMMIEYAGGTNPAKNVAATELWPTAGIEQIFEWNPDYIFITNSESATYTAKDILSKPEWKELKAVKNKHVYTMPAKNDSWEFPGIVSLLGMEYMMKTMYPKLISDKELESHVNELYRLSYGKEFSKKKLGY